MVLLFFFFLYGSTTLYRVLAFTTNFSFHPFLSCVRVFQFGTLSFRISFLISSIQRVFGLPVGLLEMEYQEYIAFTILVWFCSAGLKILVVPVQSAAVSANKISPSTGVLVRNLTVAVMVKNCPKARNSLVLFWARWIQSTSSHPVSFGYILFVFGATAPSGAGPPHSRGFLITHNDAPQSVGLLWTSDELVAETSTWQHTTLTTDKHPCPRWDSNPQSDQASGRRPTP